MPQVLEHTVVALNASKGSVAVLERFRRATELRLQHLQGDGDPDDILERQDCEAELDQAGVPNEALTRTIERFLERHLDGVKSGWPSRGARDGRAEARRAAGSSASASSGGSDGARTGEGSALIVSLSGGVDSMVLAHILLALKSCHGRRVCAVHIDYSNRSESAAEADYLRHWCSARGVALRVRVVHEVKRGKTPRDEYEKESRRIRFDAYREAMSEFGGGAIFFGHHIGDVQENVISNVMKGASVLNVAGVRNMRSAVGCLRPSRLLLSANCLS